MVRGPALEAWRLITAALVFARPLRAVVPGVAAVAAPFDGAVPPVSAGLLPPILWRGRLCHHAITVRAPRFPFTISNPVSRCFVNKRSLVIGPERWK